MTGQPFATALVLIAGLVWLLVLLELAVCL